MSNRELRAHLARSIFRAIADPGQTEGLKGDDRTLTQWQTDAVMRVLSSVGDELLPTYAREASKALTRLSGGGSEMFTRIGGEFYAEPGLCIERAEHRIDTIQRLAERKRLLQIERRLRTLAKTLCPVDAISVNGIADELSSEPVQVEAVTST